MSEIIKNLIIANDASTRTEKTVAVLSDRLTVMEEQRERIFQEMHGLRQDVARLRSDTSWLIAALSGVSAQLPLLQAAASLPPRSEGQEATNSSVEERVGSSEQEESYTPLLVPPAERVLHTFPKQLGGQSVKELFVTWYQARLFEVFPHVNSRESTKRSAMKHAVELFTLFTPRHVPPLPPVDNSTIHNATEKHWQTEVMELANEGWVTFQQFYAQKAGQHMKGRIPELVEPFVKFMELVHEDWPEGPNGSIDESFQIPTSVGHKVEQMRGREMLLLDLQRKAQRKNDRKSKATEADVGELRRRSENNTEGEE